MKSINMLLKYLKNVRISLYMKEQKAELKQIAGNSLVDVKPLAFRDYLIFNRL